MSNPRGAVARIALSHFDRYGNRIPVITPDEIQVGDILYTADKETGNCLDRTCLVVFQVIPGLARTLTYQGDVLGEIWGIGYHWYDDLPETWTYHTHQEVHI